MWRFSVWGIIVKWIGWEILVFSIKIRFCNLVRLFFFLQSKHYFIFEIGKDFATISSKNRMLLTRKNICFTFEGDSWDSLAFCVKYGHFILITILLYLVSKYDYFSSTDGTDIREVTATEQFFVKVDSLPFDRLSIDETLSIEAFNVVIIILVTT